MTHIRGIRRHAAMACRGILLILALAVLTGLAAQHAAAQEPPPSSLKVQTIRKTLAVKAKKPAAPAASSVANGFEEALLKASRAERLIPEIEKSLAAARGKIARPDISMEELGKQRNALDKLRLKILSARKTLEEPAAAAARQLKTLGPTPKDPASEDPAIAARRKALDSILKRFNADSKKLELLALESAQLSRTAAARQREMFFSGVFKPARSILNPLLWLDGMAALPDFFTRLKVLLANWSSTGGGGGYLPVGVLALFAMSILLLIYVWRRWRRPIEADAEIDDLRRLWRALRVAIYSAVVVFILLLVLNAAVIALGAPSPRIARLLDAVTSALMFAVVVAALARGIFRPEAPHMRLVNISGADARRAYRLASGIAFLYGLDFVMGKLAEILFLPVGFSVAWSALVSLLYVALMGLFAIRVRQAEPMEEIESSSAEARYFFGWTRYVFHPLLVLLLAVLLALAAGYVALAHFITTQTILTGAIVTGLYLLHHLADAAVRAALDRNTHTGHFLRRTLSIPENTITQLGVLFSTLVDIAIVLAGLPLVLMMWAVNWADMTSWVRSAFFGFKVGNITIEPSSILLGVLVLIIGLILARLLTLWLEKRVLDRTNLDSGVRHSIVTTAKYTLTIGAFLVALSVAGVNFSSLAILGGALGIGIGFGLQSIVNNFVSGLILLAERPIKVGDWIKVNGGEGVVRKIKVRSTEIETFDRCSVIVPNSSLISEPVSNWYHNSRMGRLRLLIGVSYDADPDEVEKILMRCAVSHPRALANPKPFVLFQGFGDNSLDFELRVYINDAGYITRTGSDLRFAIFRAMKAANIEIPFPQRDVHIRSMPDEIFDRGGMPPEPPESQS